MKTNLYRDFCTYRHCPEIRANIRLVWTAKMLGWASLILLSPFLLIGIVAIGIVNVVDFIGKHALWLPHKATAWLFHFQQNQIKNAHDILDIDEINVRLGVGKGHILPKTGDENGE